MQKRSDANWFILKLENIEAKLTGLIVILYFKKLKKQTFVFKKQKAKTKGFDNFAISKLHSLCKVGLLAMRAVK